MLDNENKLLDIPRGQQTCYNQNNITYRVWVNKMSGFISERNFRKRNRRKEVYSADDVEKIRVKFGLKHGEFAGLMGMGNTQYNLCKKKGGYLSFRVHAALDAIENVALNRAMKDVVLLHKIKTGMKLVSDEELTDSNAGDLV